MKIHLPPVETKLLCADEHLSYVDAAERARESDRDPLYRCPDCDGTDVQLSFPVWVPANDLDNTSRWELDAEAEPERDSAKGWCRACKGHVLIGRPRQSKIVDPGAALKARGQL